MRSLGLSAFAQGPAGAVSFLIYELGRKVIHDPKASLKHMEQVSIHNPLLPIVLGA